MLRVVLALDGLFSFWLLRTEPMKAQFSIISWSRTVNIITRPLFNYTNFKDGCNQVLLKVDIPACHITLSLPKIISEIWCYTAMKFSCSVWDFKFSLIALMLEAACTSETSVDNYFTRQCIPEDKYELFLLCFISYSRWCFLHHHSRTFVCTFLCCTV
jgi:hypothetical protein